MSNVRHDVKSECFPHADDYEALSRPQRSSVHAKRRLFDRFLLSMYVCALRLPAKGRIQFLFLIQLNVDFTRAQKAGVGAFSTQNIARTLIRSENMTV